MKAVLLACGDLVVKNLIPSYKDNYPCIIICSSGAGLTTGGLEYWAKQDGSTILKDGDQLTVKMETN